MVVSFDLFGTLVQVSMPSDPAGAVAAELSSRDVPVPDDWPIAYRESHVDAPSGAEIALPTHVKQALRSRGIESERNVTRRAVASAFVPDVKTRSGAREAVKSAARYGPVGLCSNCSVQGLAVQALVRSDVNRNLFDAIVTSVACGWRKPDSRVFESTASQLGTRVSDLTHVGDDPATDGGIEAVGGTFVDVNDVPLTAIPDQLAER
ncbi:HAD family hydrolase [Halocatena marina]|uniref:HAD family hydrolase n=1 Tax=Halocatena marina TaxID=2934937 RepID=A0ABD5YUD8_9EURY|nr:HAD family hydrolase [Halocatena marina]